MNNDLKKKLQMVFPPERISFDIEDRVVRSLDGTKRTGKTPDVIVKPRSAEEISTVFKLANEYNVPVCPRSAGTGLTGGAVPLAGGIVLDFLSMNSILEIDEENLTATLEPGVVIAQFQEEVEKRGLFYPPDPASNQTSTIGGNVAENAGGLRAIKYGVTGDYVLALEVVLPDGSIIHTGRKTMKSVTGYDLTHLFVGSEGTLGIFSKVVVKLVPLPEAIQTRLCLFSTVSDALKTVQEIIAARLLPRACEFMDKTTYEIITRYKDFGFPKNAGAVLLIEVDGRSEALCREIAQIEQIVKRNSVITIEHADDAKTRDELWSFRRTISPAILSISPDRVNEDICVSRGCLAEMLEYIDGLSEEYAIAIANFGHAGDGNIHVNILLDKKVPGQVEKVEEIVRKVFERTVELGGTLSGEHGIGITKQPYIGIEIPEHELQLMKNIKNIFDPKNILNPGKIF